MIDSRNYVNNNLYKATKILFQTQQKLGTTYTESTQSYSELVYELETECVKNGTAIGEEKIFPCQIL